MNITEKERTLIKMRLVFYILLIISVLSSVVVNIIKIISGSGNALEDLFGIVISVLSVIGFTLLIVKVAKRWRFIGASLFIGLAVMIFLSFSSICSEFHDSIYIAVFMFAAAAAWAVAGIILILNENILE